VEPPNLDPLNPTDEEIALSAYRIWLHEGCPHGFDKEHWLEARAQLISERANEKSAAEHPQPLDRSGG
jgi:hypothetical protein